MKKAATPKNKNNGLDTLAGVCADITPAPVPEQTADHVPDAIEREHLNDLRGGEE